MPTQSLDDLVFPVDLADFDPPTGAVALTTWLEDRETWLADASGRAMASLLSPALNSYADSLTATGDAAAFDGLTLAWQNYVANVGAEYLTGMQLAGMLSTAQVAQAAGVTMSPAFVATIQSWADEYLVEIAAQLNGFGATIIREATQTATTSLVTGATRSAIDEGVAAITSKAEGAAEYVMRNQVISSFNQGHMRSARALGDEGPREKVWLATLDARTRPDHTDADNQTVLLGEPFLVGGESLDAPHDPAGSAAQVANCRCTVLFLYPGDERPDGSIVPGEDEWLAEDAESIDQVDVFA